MAEGLEGVKFKGGGGYMNRGRAPKKRERGGEERGGDVDRACGLGSFE